MSIFTTTPVAIEPTAKIPIEGTGGKGYTTARKILESGTTSVAYAATVTPNADTARNLVIGALTGNLIIANPTGTPVDCQSLRVRVKQDGTGGRTVTLGNAYRLPTGGTIDIASGAGKTTRLLFEYNATDSKWDVIGNLPGH